MIYLKDLKIGNNLYREYLQERGYNRYSPFNDNCHITIGYIENIEDEHVEDFKFFFKDHFQFIIKEVELLNTRFNSLDDLKCLIKEAEYSVSPPSILRSYVVLYLPMKAPLEI